MPDICCRIDGTKEETRGKGPYIQWFNKYVGYAYKVNLPNLSLEFFYLNGDNAYSPRCAFLHDGTGDLSSQHATDKELNIDEIAFVIPEVYDCGMKSSFAGSIVERKLILNVELYCHHIIDGVEAWILEKSRK